jgi:hypothetical protein
MAIELSGLLRRAFYSERVENATESIARASARFIELRRAGGDSLEYVVPPAPDEEWVRERLLHSIVYYCESEGRPVPNCPGVFASLFVEDWLYCIAIPDIITWAGKEIGITVEDLRRLYGTEEVVLR